MADVLSSKNSSSGATRASLLARVCQSEPAAWDELVELYGPLIASWCQRCGFESHAIADCVQDVFFAVHRHVQDYEPQRTSGSFRAWLWTITRNKIRDVQRKSQWLAAGGTTALANLHELALEEDEPSTSNDTQQLVTRALAQIRIEFEARTWEIFHRSVIDQLPTQLVAEEFGVTAANVRKIRSRILHRLREQLGDV